MVAVDEDVGLIGVPSSAGAYAPGQEKAPHALREAGLVEAFETAGITVSDHGDGDRVRWRPDPDRRRAQNADLVTAVVEDTAARVETALTENAFPLVIGGDCTVGLGTVAGAVATGRRVGLCYFDLHPDLNTPQSTDDGALDWMGVAHALGVEHTVETLARAGPRVPLLDPEQVFFFGYGPENRTVGETALMTQYDLDGIPVEDVTTAPETTAEHALRTLEGQVDRLVVHFDVDTIDFVDLPLSENAGRNEGLAFERAIAALGVLLACPSTVALTITELNPDHGSEDGETVERFVDGLVEAFTKRG